jgi:hypothetical protein
MLSKRALQLLDRLFSEQSQLQLPVGLAGEVIEIRQWAKKQLEEKPVEPEKSKEVK